MTGYLTRLACMCCLAAVLTTPVVADGTPVNDSPETGAVPAEPVPLEGAALQAWLDAVLIPPYVRTFATLYCQDAMTTTPTESCIPPTCFESKVQELNGNAGTIIAGSANQQAADDFVVPADETWLVDKITFFAYQNYASYPDSSLTSAHIVVWDGDPSAGSPNVLLDRTTTYPPQTSTFTKIFRSFDTSCVTSKPVFDVPNPIAPALVLPAGTYWIGFQAEGTETNGPWMPFVTTTGQNGTVVGHYAWHRTGTTWSAVNSPKTYQDVPFCIEGTKQTYAKGDMNCDGNINGQDIDGFVLVLLGLPPYTDYYNWGGIVNPPCDYLFGDMNGDGAVNGQDIDGFVAALLGT